MPLNLYADLNEFKRRFAENATLDAVDEAEMEKVIESGSRRVDEKCRREFFALTATRVFHGNGRSWVYIPDLLADTAIKLDENSDRTFELTLAAATDYYLERPGHEDIDATPATVLRLDAVNGQRSSFQRLPRLIEIEGRWGFTEETELTGADVEDTPYSANATTLNVAAGQGALLAVGQTLLIESEQFYLSAISTDALTVTPAINGTTAADHAKDTVISRFIWVPNIREAAIIIAGRMWKRRETAFANVIANPVVGQFETFRITDPDVERLLGPYVRGDMLA